MKYPKFLKENSVIGVPAPSSSAEDELKVNKYRNAIKNWQEFGYQLVLSNNLFQCIKGRSAPAKERAREVNEMFEREDIDGIVCASGGEFLVEILPYVDFTKIENHPKWVVGFSDPTGLLYPITTKYDIATIYGNNFSHLGAEKLLPNDQDFLDVIKGEKQSFESYPLYEKERGEKVTGLEPDNYTEKVEWKTLDNKPVEVEGRIIGGCFDVIAELVGTKYDGLDDFQKRYQEDGIIWYFDNCGLSMEEVIRTLWKMNEFHYFDHTKAVLFGRFGVETAWLDYDIKSCLEDSVLNELKIPIIYDVDISHKPPSIPVINGSIAHVVVKDGKGKVSYNLQ